MERAGDSLPGFEGAVSLHQIRDRRGDCRGTGKRSVYPWRRSHGLRARVRGVLGGGEAIGVNSGTSALHVALLAAGVGPGDEVVTTPFSFAATAATILYCGATPVFADIDAATFNLDPAKMEAALSPRTKAILPVHLYGQPAEMDPILAIARRRGIAVIEDAAQAHGAEYRGRRVGSLADIACFSFYPTKNLGAYGEAGAVVTANPDFAGTVCLLRNWGGPRYQHDIRGYNYRMENLNAAMLRVKLRHLECWTESRRALAARYDALLRDNGVTLPRALPHVRHVYHAYTIRTPERDRLAEQLARAGIQSGVHYPKPIHLQPAYRDARFPEGSLPVAESAAREVLSLPIYPEMTPEQVDTVASALKDAVGLQRPVTR
jgi:dTDP-4-amino-4,6-dideoxygalactose transaminase